MEATIISACFHPIRFTVFYGGIYMLVRKSIQRIAPFLIGVSLILAGCNLGATPAPTQDLNALNTAIVGTAVAQLSGQMTGTAQALPTSTSTSTPAPTNTIASIATVASTESIASPAGGIPTISFNSTPLPGFTALAPATQAGATIALGDACSNSAFEGDITIPDGTVMKPGVDFTKIWAIRNTGTCAWDEGFALVFIAGDQAIDPYNYEFKQTKDIVLGGEGLNIAIKLTAPLAPGDYQGHWRMRNDKGYYFGTILSVYFTVKK